MKKRRGTSFFWWSLVSQKYLTERPRTVLSLTQSFDIEQDRTTVLQSMYLTLSRSQTSSPPVGSRAVDFPIGEGSGWKTPNKFCVCV